MTFVHELYTNYCETLGYWRQKGKEINTHKKYKVKTQVFYTSHRSFYINILHSDVGAKEVNCLATQDAILNAI